MSSAASPHGHPHTYAHVTVTVVMDGQTTTFDVPKVVHFEVGNDDPDKGLIIRPPLTPARSPRIHALTFSMRAETADNGFAFVVTTTR